MKILVKAVVENRAAFKRVSEPVTLAVPFPAGVINNPDALQVVEGPSGRSIPFDVTVTGRWYDGTIRWAVFTVLCSIEARGTIELSVCEKNAEVNGETVPADCAFQFIVAEPGTSKNTIGCLIDGERKRTLTLRCVGIDAVPVDFSLLSKATETTPVKKVSELRFRGQGAETGTIECVIRVYDFYTAGIVRIDATIKNRNAARHTGGYWDLGDPASFVFSELSIGLELSNSDSYGYSLDSTAIAANGFQTKPFALLQQSSGGAYWNNKNHVAAGGASYRVKKGAVIQTGGASTECDRITPTVFISNTCGVSAVTLVEFWENFPSSLEVAGSGDRCVIGLFPAQNGERYELQGGEQKKQSVVFRRCASGQPESMEWAHNPLVPVVPCEWYVRCGVYRYMTVPDNADPAQYIELVNGCIDENTGFAARREIIDEYGWRNFGELYADHESSYLEKGKHHVSHYNNQYDFMYYAMVHFWRSGDRRWHRLADQLARHVRDIDIYHTERDRFVFNGGIYWHTNHYVGAETATHRCFSAKGAHPVSGGISVQNCYFSGLLTYYYCTADPEMKEALSEVMEYVRRLVVGPEDVFAKAAYFLKEFLKNIFYDTSALITKQIYPYGLFHGPSRESGNALIALVRSYELTNDGKYLVAAEQLIKICISPKHDLVARKINEPEYRWMYLLFLQSLVEYMVLKEESDQHDRMYRHALKSFMHYIRWMAENEYSYLDKPDKLEFANETWAMQELRKPHLFYEAADRAESDEERKRYIEKAEYFEERAYYHFYRYGERVSLTRPLVLAAAYGLIPHYFRKRGTKTSR